MKSWYAVQTRSQCESKVHDSLERAEIENLYPTYEKRSKWSDREKQIIRPLFPGYLFCEIEISSERAAVVSITGVFQILGGFNPIAVPDYEIRQVRLLMACPELLAPLSYQPQTGDQVEVIDGVFRGVSGTVERWKEKHFQIQVTVRIQSLMAAATVQVDAECLRRVKASSSV